MSFEIYFVLNKIWKDGSKRTIATFSSEEKANEFIEKYGEEYNRDFPLTSKHKRRLRFKRLSENYYKIGKQSDGVRYIIKEKSILVDPIYEEAFGILF